VAAIPEVFRPVVDLPADPAALVSMETAAVGAMKEAALRREEVLSERSAARERLQAERATLDREVQDLSTRRADEVVAPLDAVVQDVNDHRDLLGGVLAELGVDEPLPAAVTTRHASVLEQTIEDLLGLTARLIRIADDQVASAGEAAKVAQAQLAAIGERLDVDPLQAGADGVVEAAHHAAQEARFSRRAAAQRTESFCTVLDDVIGLRSLLAEVEEKERALNDLDSALKPGAFAKWLALRRSRSLLVHASRMLGEMSGGRYAFADFAEADAQWRVLDRDSGQPRSPASLSGGEQFIASLSLALGLVEMMARSGGRLESLFLDEGFGALDRNNLDAAIQALGMVAAGGRMVVLISHVQAVAEQVADVAAVTRTHAGSRIEWLSGAERRHLGESEAGSAALGGLLE
jgi:exonuclease SbcC